MDWVLHNLQVLFSRTTQATASHGGDGAPAGPGPRAELLNPGGSTRLLLAQSSSLPRSLWSKALPFATSAKPILLSVEGHLQIWPVSHHLGHGWEYWALPSPILAPGASSAQRWLPLGMKPPSTISLWAQKSDQFSACPTGCSPTQTSSAPTWECWGWQCLKLYWSQDEYIPDFSFAHTFDAEGHQAGELWFVMGKSMLRVPNYFLVLHIFGNRVQEDMLHVLSKDWYDADQPIVLQVLQHALLRNEHTTNLFQLSRTSFNGNDFSWILDTAVQTPVPGLWMHSGSLSSP